MLLKARLAIVIV